MFLPEILVVVIVVGAYFYSGEPAQFLLVELAVLALLVLLFALAAWRADCRSLQVGTVTPGSPEEKQADHVLRLFSLAEHLLGLIFAALIPAFIISFFLFEQRLSLWLHNGALLTVAIACWLADRRLSRLQQQRGYG